jgi:predicted nucleic acid-binding protein
VILTAVVFDSEGLSAWIRRDRGVMTLIQEFHDMGADLVISANTIVEVADAKVDKARLNWLLSQIRVEPVTGRSARVAARLLLAAGLHGHQHAIDATVAEVALRETGTVAILTSDIDDMRRLCGRRMHLIGV